MKLTLKRLYYKEECTIGVLNVQGDDAEVGVYFCDTLEPTYRDLGKEPKVKGRTAIPSGTYKIEFRHSSRFARYMPYLRDVPFFEGIMIHPGNTPAHTKGCILVGKHPKPERCEDGSTKILGMLRNSRVVFNCLYTLLLKANQRGEEIEITILPRK